MHPWGHLIDVPVSAGDISKEIITLSASESRMELKLWGSGVLNKDKKQKS